MLAAVSADVVADARIPAGSVADTDNAIAGEVAVHSSPDTPIATSAQTAATSIGTFFKKRKRTEDDPLLKPLKVLGPTSGLARLDVQDISTTDPSLTDYERERMERIKANQMMLSSMLSADERQQVLSPVVSDNPSESGSPSNLADTVPAMAPFKRMRPAAVRNVSPTTTRVSARLKGLPPSAPGAIEYSSDPEEVDEDKHGHLLSPEEYFTEEICSKAIRVDGKYNGWLNPEVMEKFGLESSAEKAWENNGGGVYSFKDPLGLGKDAKKEMKNRPGGWSEAKYMAFRMFKKNPNMYFYRHTEPGVDQWAGEWTAPEKQTFLEVASKFGCGSKWGLFASWIPHRVGYQCSAFYRQVILPEGLIFDPNYKYAHDGRPVYVGAHPGSS